MTPSIASALAPGARGMQEDAQHVNRTIGLRGAGSAANFGMPL
eukprot:CAMPEP_0184287956 /NCGR_PEP_ID=MMETSP1049-20130417/389_1 /TAXON_ID=77928 /ORGANISM="Proteomonas sulcata, Strain CCMP704" /LENGTH=42 /DNA_ID= /DNA_START= /DNA_END= /DNA_ORIENTATION=